MTENAVSAAQDLPGTPAVAGPAQDGLHFAAPGCEEKPTPFGAMPETMPPPPVRPLLPPDSAQEDRRGWLGRLLGGR